MRAYDLKPGDSFGRWNIVRRAPNRLGGKSYWLCRCRCEKQAEREVQGSALVQGRSKSCGCLIADVTAERSLKHGLYYTSTHQSWAAMLSRCRNPNTTNYIDYGGRGIEVCERWKNFENFLADMGERPERHFLERKDTNGNYTPDNCCWATKSEQNRNRRNTRFVTANDVTKRLVDWADELHLPSKVLKLRLKAGWSAEQAVGQAPPPTMVRTFTYKGRTMKIAQWAKLYNLKPNLVNSRIWRGWTIGEAIGAEPRLQSGRRMRHCTTTFR